MDELSPELAEFLSKIAATPHEHWLVPRFGESVERDLCEALAKRGLLRPMSWTNNLAPGYELTDRAHYLLAA